MSSENTQKQSDHHIPCTRGQKFPVEVLTSGEVQALIAACGTRSPSGRRNAALIVVLWRAGLRIQEALDLKLRDLDFEGCSINVRRGKGNVQRIVGIDRMALSLVERWVAIREAVGAKSSEPLFCQITTGRVGGALDQAYVRQALKRLANRAGIEKRVHPHGLRHSLASGMAREGCPLHLVQAQLGHTSLATTQRYIAKVAPHELARTMASRTW